MTDFFKFLRYCKLYGLRRALVKAVFKVKHPIKFGVLKALFSTKLASNSQRAGIVGLGNHGFTLIAFFVVVRGKNKLSFVIYPSDISRKLATKVLGCSWYPDIETAKNDNSFFGDILYIASDHASHVKYAVEASACFARVFIEKPLFVNREQESEMWELFRSSRTDLYAGFNRPFAPLYKQIETDISQRGMVSMVINGHFLPQDHWYRDIVQGSRILGNLTHWIDLALAILCNGEEVTELNVHVIRGDFDDAAVSIASDQKLVNLLFSAQCEPGDGVEEFIFWNTSASVGQLRNFQSLSFVTATRQFFAVKRDKKDVGHELAVLNALRDGPSDMMAAMRSSSLALTVEQLWLSRDSRPTCYSLKHL